MQETKKPNAATIALIVVVLVGAAAAAAIYVTSQNAATEPPAEESTAESTEASALADASTAAYSDGVYTALGSYLSPGGQESVDVEITLSNDTITAATVTPHAASETSVQYQAEFVNNFKSLVIGKDIDEVQLSRVAGSSLTSTGFNDAVEQIKADAAA